MREIACPEVRDAVRMADELEPFERKASQKAQQEGRAKGGGDRRSAKADRSRETSPKAKQDDTKRTDAKIAKAVGVSRKTLVMSSGGPLADPVAPPWRRTGTVTIAQPYGIRHKPGHARRS